MPRSWVKNLLFALWIVGIFFSPSSNHASTANEGKKKEPPVIPPGKYAIFILIDGVRAQDLYPKMESGWLAHLKDTFLEKGAVFEEATSVFPSTSMSGHQSFYTGLMAGNSGIPQLEWFNRASSEHIDYLTRKGVMHLDDDLFNHRLLTQPDLPIEVDQLPFTVFDFLRPSPTLSIYEVINRGAAQKTASLPLKSIWPGLISKRFEAIDTHAMKEFLQKMKNVGADSFPRFTAIALYTADFIEHEEGQDTERMHYAMKHVDHFVGELNQLLKEKGIQNQTLLILSSDHGHHNTGKTINLVPVFEELGFRFHPNSDFRAGGHRRDIEYGIRSVSSANLYFPTEKKGLTILNEEELRNYTTPSGKKADLVDRFLQVEGVESLVYSSNPWKTVIQNPSGRGIIEFTEWFGRPFYAYSVEGIDPLKYAQEPVLKDWIEKKSFHSAQEWGAATRNLAYPDAIAHVGSVFEDGRAGDLILISSSPYNFMNPDNRRHPKTASHGTLLAADRRVPLLISGPGVKPGRYPFARTIDVAPTVLHWLGRLPPETLMDGRVLKELFGEKEFQDGQSDLTALASLELGGVSRLDSQKTPFSRKEWISLAQKEKERRARILERIEKTQSYLTSAMEQAKAKSREEVLRLKTLLAAAQAQEMRSKEALRRIEALLETLKKPSKGL